MSNWAPRDPNFEQRVRDSYARQAAMAFLGATMARVVPGGVVLELPFRREITQQHGFVHAGVGTSVMDSACGYAALTLMDRGTGVLSVEFKVNLLAPAQGQLFRAIGKVVRSGRTLVVTTAELRAFATPQERSDGALVAMMTATIMTVRDRPDLLD
ncbi:MAG: PaaI family thioesterase [Planctomycetes bacterium]|nr:PaaI family thioesterase [Planctomycetota bacterium]